LVCHIQGEIQVGGYRERGAEKDLWALRDDVRREWRKPQNEELYDLYNSLNIIRMTKSRRMRWAGNVARMGDRRVAYKVMERIPDGKRTFRRSRRKLEINYVTNNNNNIAIHIMLYNLLVLFYVVVN